MLGKLFNKLLKFGYPIAAGVVRTVRGLLYAILVAGVSYGLTHVGDFTVDPAYQALALVVLMGMDKYLREHKKELETEDN